MEQGPTCVICLETDGTVQDYRDHFAACNCSSCQFHNTCFESYQRYYHYCPLCRKPALVSSTSVVITLPVVDRPAAGRTHLALPLGVFSLSVMTLAGAITSSEPLERFVAILVFLQLLIDTLMCCTAPSVTLCLPAYKDFYFQVHIITTLVAVVSLQWYHENIFLLISYGAIGFFYVFFCLLVPLYLTLEACFLLCTSPSLH